jgi:GNAT superfamily N-acetyltransferase
MNALERIEATALLSAVTLGGGRVAHVGGAACVSHPLIPIPELNRAIPLEPELDLDAVVDWFGGSEHLAVVPPEQSALAEQLAARGYEQVRPWMKFEWRVGETPRTAGTALPVRETADADELALVLLEGTGVSRDQAVALAAIAGEPGWRCFVAWADDEPAGMGVLFVDGDAAWCGIGNTRPAFRRRGAQSALLAARVAAAREAGVALIATETGERSATGPTSSYDNILRAGFCESYLRPNWRSPR